MAGRMAGRFTSFTQEQRVAAFWSKVDPCRTDGCMVWLAARNANGYGWFWNGNGKMVVAHRWAYEQFVGPIPDGLELDHVKARGCMNRTCVNTDHLEPVTGIENIRRSDNWGRRKTHCPRGHAYDEVNTRHYGGRRACRECSRLRMKLRQGGR